MNGLTRRIDELGRIVIPKEIRKNLRIKSDDQLEISVDNDSIVLKKYEILHPDDAIKKMLNSLKKTLNKNVLYTSRDKIIDYSILSDKKLNNLFLNNEISNYIENRKEIITKITISDIQISSSLISPIIINGDLFGSLIIYGETDIIDFDIKIVHFAKLFFELYLE